METFKEKKTKIYHGGKGTKLYEVWCGMKQRCYCESTTGYKNYGGRGIGVCEEWRTDYRNFRDWAFANGYKDGLSIDRIENDKDYSPDNCRWATRKEQQNNQRNTLRIEYNGEIKTLHEWADIIGMQPQTLYHRIFQAGMTAERAFNKSVGRPNCESMKTVDILTELSATDNYYKKLLEVAETSEILKAIKIMEERNERDKLRLKCCKIELRKRDKISALKEMEGENGN